MRRYWTESEEDYIRENYKQLSSKELGRILHRDRGSVKNKLERMDLFRTKDDISKIISNGMRVFFKKTNRTWDRVKKDGVIYNKRDRRKNLLLSFGGKCINCSENDNDMLQFDHINNDGYLYQNKSILTQVEDNPEKFQILCANCNTKKEVYRREFERLIRLQIPPF